MNKGQSYCKVCEQQLYNHLGDIKRHSEKPKHIRNYELEKNQSTLDEFVDSEEAEKTRRFRKQVELSDIDISYVYYSS